MLPGIADPIRRTLRAMRRRRQSQDEGEGSGADDGAAAALNRLIAHYGRSRVMSAAVTEPAPTSNATTRGTELDVVAAISSAEGKGKLSFFVRNGGFLSGVARPLMLLAAGVMVGYGANRWLRSR
jgi:hypothetical protein